MPTPSRLAPLVLAAVLVPAASVAQAPPAKEFVGYRWKNLGSARYVVRTEEKSVVVMNGNPSSPTKVQEIEISLAGAGAEGPLTWLEMGFERAMLDAQPQNIVVDSTRAENPNAGPLAPMPKVYEAIRGKRIRLLVTPGGRVRKVEGLQALVDAGRAAVPEGPQRDAILALMFPTTEAAVGGQFAAIALFLPSQRQDPGFEKEETWPSPTGAGEIARKLVFVGKEEKDGSARLEVRQSLSGTSLPAVPVPGQGMTSSSPEYRQDALLSIDAVTGIPVSLEATTHHVQELRKDGTAAGSPADIQVDQTTRVLSTMTSFTSAEKASPEEESPEEETPAN